MPLGVRDMLLVVRAKDQASRTIHEVGRAVGTLGDSGSNIGQKMSRIGAGLTTIGAGIGAIGVAGIAFFAEATKTAVEFENQARKTLTQVTGFKTSLEEVKQIARNVAKDVGVPFEQLQPALYDIFSSIDVGSGKAAEAALRGIAKAAIAGDTDMDKVAKSTFLLMNNYGIAADDMTRIFDTQFKLIQRGMGTYDTIATQIGNIASTAKVAGQNIETVGGALAFATRVLPGNTAGVGVQRTFEALFNPKVMNNMNNLGVAVSDATGKFRPFKDTMNDLAGVLNKMNPQEKATAIFELFRGTGSGSKNTRILVQAITENLDQFNSIMTDVGNNKGTMDKAFDTMTIGNYAYQVDLLKNNFTLLKESIGAAFIPQALKVIDVLRGALDWFNSLDPKMRDQIIHWVKIGSVIAIVTGAILIGVGLIMGLIGSVAAVTGSVGTAIALLAGIPVIIGLLVAAGILLYKNWDTVKAIVVPAIEAIRDAFLEGFEAVRAFVGPIIDTLVDGFKAFFEVLKGEGTTTVGGFVGFMERLGTIFLAVKDIIVEVAQIVWERMKELGSVIVEQFEMVANTASAVWGAIANVVEPLLQSFVDMVTTIVSGLIDWWNDNFAIIWKNTSKTFQNIVYEVNSVLEPAIKAIGVVFNVVVAIVGAALVLLMRTLEVGFDIIRRLWEAVGDDIMHILKALFYFVIEVFGALVQLVTGILKAFFALVTGDWEAFFKAILTIVDALWDAIYSLFKQGGDILIRIVKGAIDLVIGVFKFLWDMIVGHSIIPDLINAIVEWFKSLPGRILEGLKNFIGNIIDVFLGLHERIREGFANLITNAANWGKDLVYGIINGITGMAGKLGGAVKDFFTKNITDKIGDLFKFGSPSRVMMDRGKDIAAGVAVGMGAGARLVSEASEYLSRQVNIAGSDYNGSGGMTGSGIVPGAGASTVIHMGNVEIRVDGSDNPLETGRAVKNAMHELILELRQR